MATTIEGQPRVTDALRRAVSSGRLGHGLLFSGAKGSGREKTAVALAAGLVCELGGERRAAAGDVNVPFGCGACRACRRALAGNHPDVHLVLPEAEAVRRGLAQADSKKKPSPDILVDTVRELALRLRRPAFENGPVVDGTASPGVKVAILVDAHRMNDSAQNALLKTLEEPTASTWLILIVPHERTVLPTIASRCLRLRFAPPPDAGVPVVSEQADALLRVLLEGSAAARLDTAEALGKERSDVLAALAGLEDRLGRAVRTDAAGGMSVVPWRKAVTLLDRVGAAREALEQNGNVQLTLEELLLPPSGGPGGGPGGATGPGGPGGPSGPSGGTRA
jgi:DNA polymerase-3 subunit delta'